jgi:hypothetical protein
MDERDEMAPPDVQEDEAQEKHEPYDFTPEAEETGQEERRRLDADFLVDKMMPRDLEWRESVRRHPIVSVAVAAGVGFLIGRSKGPAIVAGVSGAVTNAVMRQLSDVLEGEVFEF